MPAGEAVDDIDDAVDDEDPGEEEMPQSAGGKVAPARQGQPGGEGAGHQLPVIVRDAKEAGGVDQRPAHELHHPVNRAVRIADGADVEERVCRAVLESKVDTSPQ